jgi:hypothetical protein
VGGPRDRHRDACPSLAEPHQPAPLPHHSRGAGARVQRSSPSPNHSGSANHRTQRDHQHLYSFAYTFAPPNLFPDSNHGRSLAAPRPRHLDRRQRSSADSPLLELRLARPPQKIRSRTTAAALRSLLQLARAMRLGPPARSRRGFGRTRCPVAVGPWQPCIILPAHLLDALESAEIDHSAYHQIGLHEAAHIARFDDYALLIERTIEALFALHPAVRWITRQIDLEREIACDDFVVEVTRRPRSYASCLATMVELCGMVRPALVAAPVADDRSHLARRVEMLLDTTRRTGTHLLKRRLAAVAAIVAVLAWAAGRSPRLVAFAAPAVEHILPHLTHPFTSAAPAMLPQAAAQSDNPRDFSGSVIEDSSGTAVPSAELRVHAPGMRELAADLETDREGRFSAPDLPPGDYSVDVSKPNFITADFRIHVPGAAPTVRLVRNGVIDGQVTDSQNQPLPGQILDGGRTIGAARISILVKRPGSEELQMFKQVELEDGRYRVFDLPPGDYAVGLWYYGFKDGAGMQLYPDNAHPRIFTVAGGEEYGDINFSLPAASGYRIGGKIDLPKSGVTFALALGLPDQPLLPIAQTRTDKDGNFHFEKIPLGTYDLFAAGPDNGYTAYEATLAADPLFGHTRIQVTGPLDGLSIALSAARSFRVILRSNHSAAPAPGCPATAGIKVQPLEPWGIIVQPNAAASFNGEQTVPDLPPGRFRVIATGLGESCYQIDPPIVDLSADVSAPVIIELAAAGSIRGVLNPTAAHPSDFAVVLVDADSSDGAGAKIAFPDANGHFRFDGLHPGHYRIAASPAAEKSSARWVSDLARMQDVNITGSTPVEIALAPAAAPARQ